VPIIATRMVLFLNYSVCMCHKPYLGRFIR
jgi:hypothetical protein